MTESTFTIPDPYKGWTTAQLKRHCRKLGCALMGDEMIILALADKGYPGLSAEQRGRVDRLKQAYED